MTYTLKFTPLAEQVALRHGMDDVKAEIHKELDHLLETGLSSVDNLMFTVVAMGSLFDETVPQFLITPLGEGVMKVECNGYISNDEPLEEGPFKGKTVQFPIGEDE